VSAVTAHVEQKDVERRIIRNLAVHAAWLRWRISQRHKFVKSTASASSKQCSALHVVAAEIEHFLRPPIAHNLVIVPLSKNGNFGVKGAQVCVEQVVFVVTAIFFQSCRDLAFFLSDD